MRQTQVRRTRTTTTRGQDHRGQDLDLRTPSGRPLPY